MPSRRLKTTQSQPEGIATIDVEIVVDEPDSSVNAPTARQRSKVSKSPAQKRTRQRPETNPDLFPDSMTDYAASNRLIWEGANILTQGSDLPWLTSDKGEAYYKSLVAKGKGYISFWLTDDLYAKDPSVLERDLAIALIEEFDLRATCLHLIYAAHATQVDRPWEQSFAISDTQLEQYLGLNKNKKLNKQQKLQLMLDLAKQPCHLLVYVSWPEQGRIPTFSVSRTWLWEIAEPILHFQECIVDDEGKAVGEKQLVGFTLNIRCGAWAKYFLNEEMRLQKQAYYEYCILSKSLIQDIMAMYHHYEGAARLMTWLLFKTKINRSSPLNAEALMKIAFGESALQIAKVDSKARAKLVESWIKTVKALLSRGWQITPDAATYPMEYWVSPSETNPLNQIPDDPELAVEFWAKDATAVEGERLTDKTRRVHGKFNRLLTAKLWIQPPEAIANRLNEIDESRKRYSREFDRTLLPTQPSSTPTQSSSATKPGLKKIESGEQLKQMRIAKSLSQSSLASKIGRSASWVKMVETGKRNIQPQDHEVLLSVLS
ncbi:helix-turn-helix domain-containing protein [Leptolyngbya sp. AN03gr2]|uniref:helix-turn-helix domain-containing protein n=1 Tax=unclassified Leptolyngbya TaxID=2650499 RepID=UPI003D31F640